MYSSTFLFEQKQMKILTAICGMITIYMEDQ